MPPDIVFWLALALKLGVTASFVVVASWTAERTGPLVGAMVATLPVAAAPAYFFIALDHDAAFISASALASLVSTAANAVFCTLYSVLAQSWALAPSIALALGAWVAFVMLMRPFDTSLAAAIAITLCVFAVCWPMAMRLRHAAMPPPVRRWYDVPLRAAMVAALVASVVGLSSRLGPAATGFLALFPVVLVSLTLIFHQRAGGRVSAAITANAVPGLAGYGAALSALHLLAVPAGRALALSTGLAISLVWNLSVLLISRARALKSV
jgi:hypothetical protein